MRPFDFEIGEKIDSMGLCRSQMDLGSMWKAVVRKQTIDVGAQARCGLWVTAFVHFASASSLRRASGSRSACMIAPIAVRAAACDFFGNFSSTFRILWSLCRHRHKLHYAYLRIMPMWVVKVAWARGFALAESA